MKKILIFSIIILFSEMVVAQTFKNYNYEYSNSVFNNPERGFYRYTERSTAESSLSLSSLKSYREQGFTLIYRIFYLRDFVTKPISQAYLDKIAEDFSRMRDAGIKGVIRFAYTSSMNPPYGDATPEQINRHIAQLKPLLVANSDVIMVLQAGFIGAWGEWYYTDHFATPGSPDNVTEKYMTARKELLYKLLDALPADRMIQLRYVGYKMKFLDSIPLTLNEAYTGSPKSRISHHNDCFVSSYNDVGSYRNVTFEKNYLEKDTKYTSIGGETCDWYQLRSNCDTSLYEMARFHWSFINEDYYGKTISNWQNDGCYSVMNQKLGYRYYLLNARIQDSTKQNSSFRITFKIKNIGFSNPINPRGIEIVIRNKTTGKFYYSPIKYDLRKRELNTDIEITTLIGIPTNVPEGDYDVYLNLPDPKSTIKNRPEFSIRLANNLVWNNSLGMNSFGHTLHVNKNSSGNQYTGSNYFLANNASISTTLNPPRLTLSSFCKNAIVSFTPDKRDTNSIFVIERSTEATSGFIPISTLSGLAGIDYYKDTELDPDKTYYYRAYRDSNSVISTYSETKSITTSDCTYKYPEITVDTNENDWNAIPPSAAISNSDKEFFLKAYFSVDFLNILLKGDSIDHFSVLFDRDNNSLTGENNGTWIKSGFEYKFTMDSLFQYETGAYKFKSKIDSIMMNKQLIEFKIPLINLNIDNLQSDFRFSSFVKSKGNILSMPYEGMNSSFCERVLPPATITNFSVRHSASIATRLIATWDKCSNCDGYVLSRTEKSTNMQINFDLSPNQNQLIDDGLNINSVYSYAIYSYNFSGKSDVSMFLDISTSKNELYITDDILVWPVPATDEIHVRILSDNIGPMTLTIYSTEGLKIYSQKVKLQDRLNATELKIPVAGFAKGMYLMNLGFQDYNRMLKIIIS